MDNNHLKCLLVNAMYEPLNPFATGALVRKRQTFPALIEIFTSDKDHEHLNRYSK